MRTENKLRFSNSDLIKLILPILAERFLSMLIGITDTLMISYAGETAVSGVSLVNQLNNIFIFVFGAVSTGGAVIASQYIGKGDCEESITAASQLIMLTTLISAVMMIFLLCFHTPLLYILFGNAEAEVMKAADTYLVLSVLSFPALAVFNSSTALFRSMNKSENVLYISVFMNFINIEGNAVSIFILRSGVTGVAVSSVISRLFAAAVSLALLSSRKNEIYVRFGQIFAWDGAMLKRILGIAVPNGIETGLFQVSKVALSGIVVLFGTAQIAANAVAQNIWSMATLFCTAMGYAFVTVIGQCMGAGNVDEALYYNKKLLRITYIGSIVWNALIMAATPVLLMVYDLSAETKQLVIMLVVILGIFNALLCPLDFSLSSGLRAAGDVKYTTFSSVFATVICRVYFAVLFAVQLNMGDIGIAFATGFDRLIKAAMIYGRFQSKKWTVYKIV